MNQAIDIFKYVQRSIRMTSDVHIEDHPEMQESTLRVINDIINNKAPMEDHYHNQFVGNMGDSQGPYNTQHSLTSQHRAYDHNWLEHQAIIVRNELEEFLENVESKKRKMKIARK